MNTVHPQQPQQGNHLCQQIGHLWDTSTNVIKDYRRCTRAGCHTAQRLVRGRWREVPTRTRTHTPPDRRAPVEQPTLFRPGLDYDDPREERRVFRLLYDMQHH